IIGLVFSYRDITQRVRAERRLQTLAEISRLTANAQLDLAAIMDHSAKTMAQFYGDDCMIRILAGEPDELETVAYHHVDPLANRLLANLVVGVRQFIDQKANATILKEKKPLLITGGPKVLKARIPENLRGLLDHYPVHSWVVAPLRIAG